MRTKTYYSDRLGINSAEIEASELVIKMQEDYIESQFAARSFIQDLRVKRDIEYIKNKYK
jgi:hypothetical protein